MTKPTIGYQALKWANDIIAGVGLAAVGYGVWQIHEPSAYIVVGCVFISFSVVSAWTNSKNEKPESGAAGENLRSQKP